MPQPAPVPVPVLSTSRLVAALLLVAAPGLCAQVPAQDHAQAGTSTPIDLAEVAPVQAEPPRFEGAIGVVLNQGPAYTGAERRRWSASPSVYLRYGRWTFSTSGVFVNRRKDDVMQGLGRDLHRSDTLRTHLSLRLQRGGRSARSEALPDAERTRDTVMGRVTATWMPDGLERGEGARVTLGLASDLLGRGGGQTLDLGLGREHRVGTQWRWNYGVGLSAASASYLRQRFEVTPQEAARTGLPAYRPGGGLREASVGTGGRWQFDRHWQFLGGVSAFRLLGPAADSPLTERRAGWSMQLGSVYSF